MIDVPPGVSNLVCDDRRKVVLIRRNAVARVYIPSQ